MEEKLHHATHEGDLKIGHSVIPSAVLDDETRVLISKGFLTALGRPWRGTERRTELPNFIAATNLSPFITKDLRDVLTPVKYKNMRGTTVTGYRAELLPLVCDVYLEARATGSLIPRQLPIAKQAEILVRSLSKIGIIALVDEATGYQGIRDRIALQKILEEYLLEEYERVWAKRFPDEFYVEMFRLKNWQWKGMQVNRPSVVGTYTNDIVYKRISPEVLEEIKKRNKKLEEEGSAKVHQHRWLTLDTGIPALDRHLHAVIALMRAAPNWGSFHRSVKRAFPVKGDQIPMDIPEKGD